MHKKQYWTENEIALLRKAQTPEEFADVALTILKMMSLKGNPITMICGPIVTGGLDTLRSNALYFKHAGDTALQQGWKIFDQLPFYKAIGSLDIDTLQPSESCMKMLRRFDETVLGSGYIHELVFLPEWESSREATWQCELAHTLRIKTSTYPEELLISC